MRSYIWAVFVLAIFCSVTCFPVAANAGIEVRLYNEEDNVVGEIWRDDDMFFRVGIIPSGAVQAATGSSFFNLIVVPELSGGFFTFHLQ